jgi:hypothetical protein
VLLGKALRISVDQLLDNWVSGVKWLVPLVEGVLLPMVGVFTLPRSVIILVVILVWWI